MYSNNKLQRGMKVGLLGFLIAVTITIPALFNLQVATNLILLPAVLAAPMSIAFYKIMDTFGIDTALNFEEGARYQIFIQNFIVLGVTFSVLGFLIGYFLRKDDGTINKVPLTLIILAYLILEALAFSYTFSTASI